PGGGLGGCGRYEALEAVGVERALAALALVPRRARHEPFRPERLPELRHVDLERLRRPLRSLLAPELVDEPLGRDDAIPVQQEEGEEGAGLLRPEAHRLAFDADLERPEEP